MGVWRGQSTRGAETVRTRINVSARAAQAKASDSEEPLDQPSAIVLTSPLRDELAVLFTHGLPRFVEERNYNLELHRSEGSKA